MKLFYILLVIVFVLSCATDEVELGIPVLVLPSNGSTISQNPPTFCWQGVEDADDYWLQISADSLFDSSVIDATCLVDTIYTPADTLIANEYFWRVCARVGG